MRTLRPTSRQGWRELLTAHREQLREWADNYPPTFADKYALVSAEIARLEGRDADAMRLYEQAIRSAREHGFVQNEGTGPRGGRAVLRGARRRKDRPFLSAERPVLLSPWGAHGKVRQLDERYPHLRRGNARELRRRHDWRAGRAAGRRDGGQGFAGRVGRDRSREPDQDADGDRGRACRR